MSGQHTLRMGGVQKGPHQERRLFHEEQVNPHQILFENKKCMRNVSIYLVGVNAKLASNVFGLGTTSKYRLSCTTVSSCQKRNHLNKTFGALILYYLASSITNTECMLENK